VARGLPVRTFDGSEAARLALNVLRRRRWLVGAIASISISSGRRWADEADEGPPSEGQSIWKLVVAEDAEGGLERSLFAEAEAEAGLTALLTDKRSGIIGRCDDSERADSAYCWCWCWCCC
jgi:hypothetical protein